MKRIADVFIDLLIEYGVTEAFGIPGGVIIQLVEAISERPGEIKSHLFYHEESAGFAACGYAEANGSLAMAYSTRGPGIAKMVCCIAESFQESLPVVFVTAHGNRNELNGSFCNQEMDIVSMTSKISKMSVNIETKDDFISIVPEALELAESGRKGPVVLDILSSLLDEEISDFCLFNKKKHNNPGSTNKIINDISKELNEASKPVILIGNGVRNTVSKKEINAFIDKIDIPVVSSRGSLDLLISNNHYFGYIGSHGNRTANFILSNADLIIVLGNRLAFPHSSKSYSPIIKNSRIIHVDIEKEIQSDYAEFAFYRRYVIDLAYLVEKKDRFSLNANFSKWNKICENINTILNDEDINKETRLIEEYIKEEKNAIYVCDVGNNEFSFSKAFAHSRVEADVIISKSFGSLGCSLGKAIGVYYALKKTVHCVVGDQGLQTNIQELEYIVSHNLPIKVILINNKTSGMIADCQKRKGFENLVHVNYSSGYFTPNFKKISKAYGFPVLTKNNVHQSNKGLYEIQCDYVELTPYLPKGNSLQVLCPAIKKNKVDKILNMINK